MGVEVLFLLLTGALFLGAFVTGSGSGAADEPDEEDPRVITGTDGAGTDQSTGSPSSRIRACVS